MLLRETDVMWLFVCVPQDDYECVVKMISCPSWPAAFSPLRNVFELINKVKAWLAKHEQSQGPVIVVDKCVCLNGIRFLYRIHLPFLSLSCSCYQFLYCHRLLYLPSLIFELAYFSCHIFMIKKRTTSRI